jgi:hypothetical protein
MFLVVPLCESGIQVTERRRHELQLAASGRVGTYWLPEEHGPGGGAGVIRQPRRGTNTLDDASLSLYRHRGGPMGCDQRPRRRFITCCAS